MKRGTGFSRSSWATSPLRLFAGHRVQVQQEEGDWVTGSIHLSIGGIEIVYEEPRPVAGYVESSRTLDRDEASRLRTILRPETLWSDEVRIVREKQIWESAHPSWHHRLGRWSREIFGRDPIAAEPLLRRFLGRTILVEISAGPRKIFASGLLLAYDREFLALSDATLPAETSLPLCPGKTAGADLEIVWNDDGLELFNRGGYPVQILGIRTADGSLPWELSLRAGFRERTDFRRAPAGTAEIVFESPVKGDAILSRAFARVRGASEGSIAIPALPDPSTRMEEITPTGPLELERDPILIGSDRN